MSLFTEFSEEIKKEEGQALAGDGSVRAESFEAARDNYLRALREKSLEMQADGNFDLGEADIRFSTSLNLARVRNSLVAIVGAGGLGNWQWRILAAMGFKRIAIYDGDTVGIENVGPQAHSVFDLGLAKTEAVENAALIYRGMKIIGRNRKVFTFADICEDLGEVPDIVIGCTDSVSFRNRFIESLTDMIKVGAHANNQYVPDLFIDYRMSLGDWVAYIVPARAMRNVTRRDATSFCHWYENAAVFPEERAVHEPCTERAIAYTGANVASFTGALLHWFYSGGRAQLNDPEYMRKFLAGETGMPARKTSFSSRDFEFITDTPRERKMAEKIKKHLENERNMHEIARMAFKLPPGSELLDSGFALNTDYRERYRGKVVVLPETGNVFLCSDGCDLKFTLESIYAHDGDDDDDDDRDDPDTVTLSPLEREPSIFQPFWVFDLPDYVKCGSLLISALNAKYGDILEEDSYSLHKFYWRVQKDMLEGISPTHNYRRMKWGEVPRDSWRVRRCEDDNIRCMFDSLSESWSRESAGEGVMEQPERRPLGADSLLPGMWVSIEDEVYKIMAVGAASFQAVDETGERINFSLRRMPEIYEVPRVC